jgi:hypothetical protein
MPNIVCLRAGPLDGIFELEIQQSAFASLAQPWDKPPEGIPVQG